MLMTKISNRDQCHYIVKQGGPENSIRNLRYSVPKGIPLVVHNESNYDYHFIVTKPARKFERKFSCLEENTEKHITFSVPIKNK